MIEWNIDTLSLLPAAQPVLLIMYCMVGTMLEILLTSMQMLLTTLLSRLPLLSSHWHLQAAMGKSESWLDQKDHCDFSRDIKLMAGGRDIGARKTSCDAVVLAL